MSRTTARGAVLALALVALGGCGIGAEPRPQPLPSASTDVAPTTTPSPPAGRRVTVYLLDGEGRLRAVRVGGPSGPYESSALEALLQVGTTLTPPAGLRSLVPRGTTLNRVVVYPSDLLVDLGPQFLELAGQDQVLATAQLVLTATERRPGAGVRLSVAGRDVPVPAGDGSLRSSPVRRDDYRGLVPAPTPSP